MNKNEVIQAILDDLDSNANPSEVCKHIPESVWNTNSLKEHVKSVLKELGE